MRRQAERRADKLGWAEHVDEADEDGAFESICVAAQRAMPVCVCSCVCLACSVVHSCSESSTCSALIHAKRSSLSIRFVLATEEAAVLSLPPNGFYN